MPSPNDINPFTTSGTNAIHAKNTLPAYLQLVLQDGQAIAKEAPVTWGGMGLSTMVHLGVIILLVVGFILVDLFNWEFKLLDLPELSLNKPTQLEYVIVNNTRPETPRDKATKNRADVASRSGGVKTKQPVQSEAQSRAGGQPSPSQQATRAGTPAKSVAPPTKQSTPQKATPQKAVAKSATSTPAPKRSTPTKAQSPSPSTKKAPVTKKAPIAVTKPTATTPSSGGSSKPAAQGNDIGWDEPGPILTAPSSSSGGSGSSSGPARVATTSGGGNAAQNRAASSANVKGAGGSGNLSSSTRGGGGGGLAGVDALPEPDMSPYIAQVNSRIRRNWSTPDAPKSTLIIYTLRISRGGQLVGLSLKKTSGNATYDQVAQAAVRASSPFPALPAGFKGQTLDIDFYFDYNKVSSR
jgi:periplasmic protein TonB